MRLLKRIIFIFFGLTLLVACRKEGDKVNWNIDALAPLAHTSLTIGNLVPDSLITYNENNAVSLSFSDTLLKFDLDTLIQMPDTTVVDSFISNFSFPEPLPPGTNIPAIEEEIEIESGDIELKKAKISSGKIIIDLISSFQGPVSCTYIIPGATLDGVPLELSETIPASTDEAPVVVHLEVDVSGYWIDFTTGEEPFNHLPSTLTITAATDAPPLPLSFGDGIKISTTFKDLTPEFAEGYFGQQLVNTGTETQEIDAFEIIQSGFIDLEEVNVNLRILNGFGVDVRATLFQFDADNESIGTSVSLNHAVLGAPINLNRATHPDGYPVPSVYDINLNEGNSDIDMMLENFPDAFVVEADLELNPLGNISGHHDFVYAESRIDGILDVDIPLSLIAQNVVLSDTTEFSAGDVFEDIHSGTLIIRINNGFPLEGKLWITSLPEDDQSPLSILDFGTFSSGITDENLVVVSPTSSEILIPLNAEVIHQLQQSNQLVIKAELSTANISEHIRLYKHYAMDLKVIADFNYHVND